MRWTNQLGIAVFSSILSLCVFFHFSPARADSFSADECKNHLAAGNVGTVFGLFISGGLMGTKTSANRIAEFGLVSQMIDESSQGGHAIDAYLADVKDQDRHSQLDEKKVKEELQAATQSQENCDNRYHELENPDPEHPGAYEFNAYRIQNLEFKLFPNDE